VICFVLVNHMTKTLKFDWLHRKLQMSIFVCSDDTGLLSMAIVPVNRAISLSMCIDIVENGGFTSYLATLCCMTKLWRPYAECWKSISHFFNLLISCLLTQIIGKPNQVTSLHHKPFTNVKITAKQYEFVEQSSFYKCQVSWLLHHLLLSIV
jgi:hypothetical protein